LLMLFVGMLTYLESKGFLLFMFYFFYFLIIKILIYLRLIYVHTVCILYISYQHIMVGATALTEWFHSKLYLLP
jgi:hypothetical protein